MRGKFVIFVEPNDPMPTDVTITPDGYPVFTGMLGEFQGQPAYTVTIDQDVPNGIGAWRRFKRDGYLYREEHGVIWDRVNPVTGSLGFDSDIVKLDRMTFHPFPGSRPFPPESGRLEISGHRFYSRGQVWAHRGASMFNLPARFKAGEDITPQVRWAVKHGVSTLRVFPNWVVDWRNGPNRQFDDPAHIGVMGEFADALGRGGLRTQFSVVTENGLPVSYWQQALQQIYDLQRDTMTVEPHNEPWVRDTTPQACLQGVNRHNVLSSMGIVATPAPTDGFLTMAPTDYLEFGTHRTSRDQYYPKNGKDLVDLTSTTPIPWIDDEPTGIADVVVRGGRTNDKTAVLSHYAVSALFGGATIHTESGIDGLTPEQRNEPVTEDICAGITDLWKFIPPEAQLGGYVNVGREQFGLLYQPGDSLINRAYGSWDGTTLYAVVPVPRPGWQPVVAPGWRIVETGPVPYVLKMMKS